MGVVQGGAYAGREFMKGVWGGEYARRGCMNRVEEGGGGGAGRRGACRWHSRRGVNRGQDEGAA